MNAQSPASLVLSHPAPSPEDSAAFMAAKLAFHTDCWDVGEDLRAGVTEIIVIDTRSPALYAAGHVPGAISFPHRNMTAESTARLDRSKTYVCYCDGIGCNGSTKGAWLLASRGFQVKEMLGGLDFWIRDGFPVARGAAPGRLQGESLVACSCG